MSERPYTYRTNDRKVVTLLLLGLLVLFGGVYVAGYLFSAGRIPTQTTIAGVSVGGLTPADAEARLRGSLDQLLGNPVVVRAGHTDSALDPRTSGLGVNVAASVARAGAERSWNPARMWTYFTGGDDLAPVVSVNRFRLYDAVAKFAGTVDRAPVEGRVSFTGGVATPDWPHDGAAIDQDATATAVARAFLHSDSAVVAPLHPVQPEISASDVSRAMNSFGNPAVSGPVTIRLGRGVIMLSPARFAPAIALVREDGRLVPYLNRQQLMHIVRPMLRGVAVPPKDAAVALVGDQPAVTPSTAGTSFDPRQVAHGFLRAVAGHDRDRTMVLRPVATQPHVTTADADQLGITTQVAESSATFPADQAATLDRMVKLLNGIVVRPGRVFSLDKTLGAPATSNDGVVGADFSGNRGGDASGLAGAVYHAAFLAGLQDAEGSTGAWPAVDLRFKDDTPYGVMVQAWADSAAADGSRVLHVRLWSTSYWDIKTGCAAQKGHGKGFDLTRLFYKVGSSVLDHKDTSLARYAPDASLHCS